MDAWTQKEMHERRRCPPLRTYTIRYAGRPVSPWTAHHWKFEDPFARVAARWSFTPAPLAGTLGTFQIQFRAPDGRHRTLDGVRSDDSTVTVIEAIAIKIDGSKHAACMLSLIREGKVLKREEACGLSSGDTVHVVARLAGGAPVLRNRRTGRASGSELPPAPVVSFYQGERHGGERYAELAWYSHMDPAKGSFADPWISAEERAALPPHLGVIVTYLDRREAWEHVSIATESAILTKELSLIHI